MENPNPKTTSETVATDGVLIGPDTPKNKGMKNALIVLICFFILFVTVALAYFIENVNSGQNRNKIKIDTPIERQSENRPCTLEAKMCPDGSSVGRQGPNCEFAECPASPSAATLIQ